MIRNMRNKKANDEKSNKTEKRKSNLKFLFKI